MVPILILASEIFAYICIKITHKRFFVSLSKYFSFPTRRNFLHYVDKFPLMNNTRSDSGHLLLFPWCYGSPNTLSFFLLYNDIPLPVAF